ncbi:uncharacterized protein LOC143465405 isoform X2 [Clavelina lepadiformis]|uniref:EF-hand domain-containing protein n=1 Tax=Clavelina lepadiformis TaxID=159417 RepID=A0ABP0G5D7_CLALP
MVKKKGKKSKKKSSGKTPSDGPEDLQLDGDGAQLGISKKKKAKKAKLTKEDKAALKLAKKLEKFILDEAAYKKFLDKIDHWMMVNCNEVESLFKNFDQEGDGVVTFQVFRAGLHDLHCPITDLEVHALCQKLDPEGSGLIEYCEFKRGIHDRVFADDVDGEEHNLTPDDFSPEIFAVKENSVKENLSDPFQHAHPRYIQLNMRLATFDAVANHPCHFRVTVHSHIPVGSLVKLVGEVSKVTSGQMHVYKDKDCEIEQRLLTYTTLEDNGLTGGPLRQPTIATLYYDYVIEFSDCPLLNSDHYFGIEKRPLNPVLTAYPGKKFV